jgi:hypothetical protein
MKECGIGKFVYQVDYQVPGMHTLPVPGTGIMILTIFSLLSRVNQSANRIELCSTGSLGYSE